MPLQLLLFFIIAACPKTRISNLLEQLLFTQNPWCRQLGKATILAVNYQSKSLKIATLEDLKQQNQKSSEGCTTAPPGRLTVPS